VIYVGLAKDFRAGLDMMFRPIENTKKSMSVGAAYKWYYRATVIPLIVLILVALALVSVFAVASLASVFGTSIFSLGVLAAIVAPIVFMWVLVPIGIFVKGGIYHIVGRWSGQFKGDFSKSLTAAMFGEIPAVFFLFVLLIPGSAVLYLLFAIWSLIVLVLGFSNQQKVHWTVALGVVVVAVVIIAALVGLLAAVFAVTVNSTINGLLPHFLSNNGYASPFGMIQ
jgi:hypothetical protein